MKFQSINEIQNFSFEDCIMNDFEIHDTTIRLELEALIIKSRNSQNTQFVDSYSDTTQLRMLHASIVKGFEEGYKFYDANGNLLNKVDDIPYTKEEIIKTLNRIKGCYLFALEKNEDGNYVLGFEETIDDEDSMLTEKSYIVEIACESVILEWERYMNRVQR